MYRRKFKFSFYGVYITEASLRGVLYRAEAWNFIKEETLAEVVSCEFCEISENTFSYRKPPVAAYGINLSNEHFTPIQRFSASELITIIMTYF